MSRNRLSRIRIEGFKSIRECDIDLGPLNILIGPNGAGKSNFLEMFRMIRGLMEGNLQLHVSRQGGPDAMLHHGRKVTGEIRAEFYFGDMGYKVALGPTVDNRMVFSREMFWCGSRGDLEIGSGHFETKVEGRRDLGPLYDHVVPPIQRWRLYHFHDTGDSSPVKQRHGINDNLSLRSDARNLAAFLYLLQNRHASHYLRIVKTIRLVAPFFDDFVLRPQPDGRDWIELEWRERGDEAPYKAHLLSDGTLRFICLATILLQPEDYLPETVLIDEPELGLHPYATRLLAGLLRSLSLRRQVIVSTQSTDLLNEFEPNDVVVTDRQDGCSTFRRLDARELSDWLEEYSLGELWQKNLLGGRPSR